MSAERLDDQEEVRYQKAKKRAQDVQGWLTHLIVFCVFNFGFFLINVFTRGDNGTWWFYWPLLGWGVALLMHTAAFLIPVFSPDWAERRARTMMQR